MNMMRVSTYAKHQTRENVYNKLPVSLSNVSPLVGIPQAYTSKRRILIEVLPVPNAYTKSADACIQKNLAKYQIWYTHWGQEVPQ